MTAASAKCCSHWTWSRLPADGPRRVERAARALFARFNDVLTLPDGSTTTSRGTPRFSSSTDRRLRVLRVRRPQVDERSRQKFERFDVHGTDNRKVPMIQRCDLRQSKPFGCSGHRCVDGAEGKVSIAPNKLRDPDPVGGKNRFCDEVPECEITEELDLGTCPETGRDEVSNFCHDERRDEEGPRVGLQELPTRGMVAIVGVDVGEQWARVDEEGYAPTSARRISSILSEMSSRPLCPAPVARRRRVPRFVPR
jgi:hypothetical protein